MGCHQPSVSEWLCEELSRKLDRENHAGYDHFIVTGTKTDAYILEVKYMTVNDADKHKKPRLPPNQDQDDDLDFIGALREPPLPWHKLQAKKQPKKRGIVGREQENQEPLGALIDVGDGLAQELAGMMQLYG